MGYSVFQNVVKWVSQESEAKREFGGQADEREGHSERGGIEKERETEEEGEGEKEIRSCCRRERGSVNPIASPLSVLRGDHPPLVHRFAARFSFPPLIHLLTFTFQERREFSLNNNFFRYYWSVCSSSSIFRLEA